MVEDLQFDQIESALASAKKINAKDPAVLEIEAALFMAERNFPAAAKSARPGWQSTRGTSGCWRSWRQPACRQGEQPKVEELTKSAQAINPRPADFYAIVGEWEAAGRQFDLGQEGTSRRPLHLAPWDPNPLAGLGMMYMQTGQEDLASQTLDRAFAIDRFNARTKNVLDLLDKLVSFGTVESEHFIIHFNKSTDAIVGPISASTLEGVYAEITRNYNTRLARKVDYRGVPQARRLLAAVSGRSWIPTVGACTGWVSPSTARASTVGQKNPRASRWATTGPPCSSHEFTHVVTLAATGNRIPHWFTEALAVAGGTGRRAVEVDPDAGQAVRADKLTRSTSSTGVHPAQDHGRASGLRPERVDRPVHHRPHGYRRSTRCSRRSATTRRRPRCSARYSRTPTAAA